MLVRDLSVFLKAGLDPSYKDGGADNRIYAPIPRRLAQFDEVLIT